MAASDDRAGVCALEREVGMAFGELATLCELGPLAKVDEEAIKSWVLCVDRSRKRPETSPISTSSLRTTFQPCHGRAR